MTLVVGAHLGDGVGVAADTRVAILHRDGGQRFLDDCQKVYQLGACLVGFAGDVHGAGVVLSRFGKHLRSVPQDELLARCSEIDWLHAPFIVHQPSSRTGGSEHLIKRSNKLRRDLDRMVRDGMGECQIIAINCKNVTHDESAFD